MHKCLGESCEQWITYRFALCRKCEDRYGKRTKEWPPWLRFLWNDTQRQRRKNRLIRQREVRFPDGY